MIREYLEIKSSISTSDAMHTHINILSNRTQKLLASEYVDLQSTYFDATYFDFIERDLDTLSGDSCYPDSLVSFNDDLEKFATECCGFKIGSFSFSKSYYKVMKMLFPSITHPFH